MPALHPNASGWGRACITALAWIAAVGCVRGSGPLPDAAYSPAEVVRLQVDALRGDVDDRGIEQAFRFASPENKRATGPLERFVRIVRAPDYLPMLNHASARFLPPVVEGDQAVQLVEITARDGSLHTYVFLLSKQRAGALEDCWMTDGVQLLESEPAPGVQI